MKEIGTAKPIKTYILNVHVGWPLKMVSYILEVWRLIVWIPTLFILSIFTLFQYKIKYGKWFFKENIEHFFSKKEKPLKERVLRHAIECELHRTFK